jgi:CDGSH iron-sulfur domain-containing protein 3
MSNKLPNIAFPKSIKVEVKAGQKYSWCACGLSDNQPFCDGSHAGTGFAPVTYTADEDKLVGFCGCKHTATSPLCDGAHKQLVVE